MFLNVLGRRISGGSMNKLRTTTPEVTRKKNSHPMHVSANIPHLISYAGVTGSVGITVCTYQTRREEEKDVERLGVLR